MSAAGKKEAEKRYPLTYRYDGDELPDRDAPAARVGFEAGYDTALQRAVEILRDIEESGGWSTIDFDAGYEHAAQRGQERMIEELET